MPSSCLQCILQQTCAVRGGLYTCLHPPTILHPYYKEFPILFRMGVLSPDGICKSFDKDGNGYARSEAVAAIFIQKEKDAFRVYAKVLHGKTNCDGYKEMGITYPSGDDQCDLMTDVWREMGINPVEVSYLESHGTGR